MGLLLDLPIFEIELINPERPGHKSYKFVEANSPSEIRAHPERHVGHPIRIGKIYLQSAKTITGANRINQKQHGWRVIGGTRFYGYKKEKTKGGSRGLADNYFF